MFKKSDNQGDKTPKQDNENKNHVSKTAETAGQAAPKAEKTASPIPANEAKKS